LKARQFEPAEHHLAQANQLAPGNFLVLNYLGRTLREVGKSPDAIAAFQSSLQIQPTSPRYSTCSDNPYSAPEIRSKLPKHSAKFWR
jgi:Flp pilus assembly protein TadD